MRKFNIWLIGCSIAAIGLASYAWFSLNPTQIGANAINNLPNIPLPSDITAKSYLLIDTHTGLILAEKDADMPVEPASLTKLMTAYLVFEALENKEVDLEQTFTVSTQAYSMVGSRMFVGQDAQVRVEDLLKGMIVLSGNDATIVLAEGVGGSVENFVSMMNQKAQTLGLRHTTFMNPEGLNVPGHTTTARDLALLSLRLMQDFPQFYHYYSLKKLAYQSIRQTNHNRLLFMDPSVDGMMTGYSNTMGYAIVASGNRGTPNMDTNRRLLFVLLGAESENARTQESQKLLEWGYQAWHNIQIAKANTSMITPKIWYGASNQVKLGSMTDMIVTVPQNRVDQVKTTITTTYTEPLLAPLAQGTVVGTIKVTLDTDHGSIDLASSPLVILEDAEEAGVFGRTWDSIILWFKN